MKTPGEAIRNSKALEVYQRANEGLSIVDACRELGMPRSTFYDIVKRNPDAIAQYQEMIEASAREQLGMIIMNKTQILEKIIDDALANTTKPKDRLVIYKSLSDWLEKQSQSLQVESAAQKSAHEFLKQGPKTVIKKSRMTESQTTVTMESETNEEEFRLE